MAVTSSSASKPISAGQKGKISNNDKTKEEKTRKQSDGGCNEPAKRAKCPGVRVIHGRIYDSENGKTCHQCRQKTMDFSASCKNQKNGKPCTFHFCHKCLLNRYGEKAEEMAVVEDWNCPKCRGICNCSFCMKKRGHQPTGMLVHTAKATGFSSVSELLHVKGPENRDIGKVVEAAVVRQRKTAAPINEPAVALPTRQGKENSLSKVDDSTSHPLPLPSSTSEKKLKKMKRKGLTEKQDGNQDDGVLLKKTIPIKPQSSNERLKETQDGNLNDGVLLRRHCERKLKQMKRNELIEKQDGDLQDGVLLKNPIKPQTSNERPKETRDGSLNDEVLMRTSPRKPPMVMVKEVLKNTQESKQGDGILLSEAGAKKFCISTGIFKKEVKTSGEVDGVQLEENNLKPKVFRKVSSHLISCERQRDSTPHEGAEMFDDHRLDKDGENPEIVEECCKGQNKDIGASIPLPQGTELTTVAGIDLPTEDVGHALQFLEFCAAFEEILELKRGEPEYVLRELINGKRRLRGKKDSRAIQFHIQLLSLIQMDSGEDSPLVTPEEGDKSWLHALQNCASTSPCDLKELKLDWFGEEANDYDSLDSSKKLRLLTFLCDEVLCTAKIRTWIEDQNSKFVENVKETKERALAAKHKEKQLKQKMLDEIAKAVIEKNGAPISISEHEAIVSQIKTEAAQAHAEMLESKDMVPNDKQISDAVRTGPVIFDTCGRVFWRLKGNHGDSDSNVLLQDMGTWDAVESSEKWFTFDVEQEKEIEKYLSFQYLRSTRKRRPWPSHY